MILDYVSIKLLKYKVMCYSIKTKHKVLLKDENKMTNTLCGRVNEEIKCAMFPRE